MEYLTTDKEGIKILIEVLKEKGIRQVVLSPGSRNAPLLVAFAREKQIRHFVVLDERSAAFMALGMAQQSGVPVALVCTSGTAPLNYAPAIAEAYYQRLPLIVITADRPVEWIDQDDSQTIRQQAVFRNIVKASYQLPAELFHADEHWYANRLVNDALNTALKGRQGPEYTLAGIALWAKGLPGAGSKDDRMYRSGPESVGRGDATSGGYLRSLSEGDDSGRISSA